MPPDARSASYASGRRITSAAPFSGTCEGAFTSPRLEAPQGEIHITAARGAPREVYITAARGAPAEVLHQHLQPRGACHHGRERPRARTIREWTTALFA